MYPNHRINSASLSSVFLPSLFLLSLPPCIMAQEEVPELTGMVAFNVTSKSGRVERLVISIGDGGKFLPKPNTSQPTPAE